MTTLRTKAEQYAPLLLILLIGAFLRGDELLTRGFPCPDMGSYLVYSSYYLDLLHGGQDLAMRIDTFAKPGFLMLCMFAVSMFGKTAASIHLMNFAFGLLNIFLAFKVAAKLSCNTAGYIAAAFVATFPIILHMDRFGIAHTASGSLLLLLILAYLGRFEDDTPKTGYKIGALFAASVFVHPTMLFCLFPFLAAEALIFLKRRDSKESLTFILQAAATAAALALGMDLLHKALFLLIPELSTYPGVPFWKSGYFYNLLIHKQASTGPKGTFSLLARFSFPEIKTYTGIFTLSLAYACAAACTLVWAAKLRIQYILLSLLFFFPLVFWSIFYPNPIRVLYPYFLCGCILFGISITWVADIFFPKKYLRILAALLVAVILITNTTNYYKMNPTKPTESTREEAALREIRASGFKKILIYGQYKPRTFNAQLHEVFGYDLYTISSRHYVKRRKNLIQALKNGRYEGVMFIDYPRYAASGASKEFQRFATDYDLHPIQLFPEGDNPAPQIKFYPVSGETIDSMDE